MVNNKEEFNEVQNMDQYQNFLYEGIFQAKTESELLDITYEVMQDDKIVPSVKKLFSIAIEYKRLLTKEIKGGC